MAKISKAVVTLASVDTQLANYASVVAYYEALSLCLSALGEDPMPVGHSYFLVSLVEQGKTTFKKDIDKTIIKIITKIAAGKIVDRYTWKAIVNREVKEIRTKFEQLVNVRHTMQATISDKKVEAIIKGATTKPTVTKARAHVKKEATKHGLTTNKKVMSFLET